MPSSHDNVSKWFPAVGDRVLKDKFQDDDCSRFADLVLKQHIFAADKYNNKASDLTDKALLAPQMTEHQINEAFAIHFRNYDSILRKNVNDVSHDPLNYVREFKASLAKPDIVQFRPRQFQADSAPSIEDVRNRFPAPENPYPYDAEREPKLRNVKYSRQGSIALVALFALILHLAVTTPLLTSLAGLSAVSTIITVILLIILASSMSSKLEEAIRWYNPFSRRAWKIDHANWVKAQTLFSRRSEAYSRELDKWNSTVAEEHKRLHDEWKARSFEQRAEIEALNKEDQQRADELNAKRMAEYSDLQEQMSKIKTRTCEYLSLGLKKCEERAIGDYFRLAALLLWLPTAFPREVRLRYLADSKALLIFFRLPGEENILSTKEVRFIKKKQYLQSILLKQKEQDVLYEAILSQIALSCISHLLACDRNNYVETFLFQGWLKYLDKSVGKIAEPTIMTVQVSRELASSIDYQNVDPIECFNRRLKGVCATKTKTVVPVKPIIVFDKNDPRFIAGYDVISTVNTEMNLATMDWQDFEHLVRDLFDKKYCSGGQEVKITRSSRDKGVDAVLFDPDPIKGGKIIIQAKRYINTVPVSAVRDLYGTVMSEGANRGILVTTAQYGSDSYEFAKDKPLTLLSGNEVLSLLLDIGVNARIDLNEARRLNIDSTT